MHERDGCRWEAIEQAIRFVASDVRPRESPEQFPGWGLVIGSAAKLREKFDKVLTAMRRRGESPFLWDTGRGPWGRPERLN